VQALLPIQIKNFFAFKPCSVPLLRSGSRFGPDWVEGCPLDNIKIKTPKHRIPVRDKFSDLAMQKSIGIREGKWFFIAFVLEVG
jgi:hypothetical protein